MDMLMIGFYAAVAPVSSPFGPVQRALILVAAGVAVAVACGYLLSAFHPRWRRGEFRYAPVGLAILLLLAAGELLVVVYAMPFLVRHLAWMPVPPVVGFALLFLADFYDERRRKASMPKMPKASDTPPRETPESERVLLRNAVVYAKVLAALLIGTVFNLICRLVGPRWGWAWIFSIGGFLLAISLGFLAKHPLGIRFIRACPQGLAGRIPRLENLRAPLLRTMKVVAVCWLIALGALVISSRMQGVPADDLPVFAPRKHYRLTDHGKITEVTRLRHSAAAAGGLVAWHSGALFASLTALHLLLFGKFPETLQRA
jgi:hypothetical protein